VTHLVQRIDQYNYRTWRQGTNRIEEHRFFRTFCGRHMRPIPTPRFIAVLVSGLALEGVRLAHVVRE
jgi:hypothetical protein